MSLNEAEAVVARKPGTLEPQLAPQLAGAYEIPTGFKFQVVVKNDRELDLVFPGQPEEHLILYRGLQFRLSQFADQVFEFVREDGQVKALKQRDPSGEYVFPRK